MDYKNFAKKNRKLLIIIGLFSIATFSLYNILAKSSNDSPKTYEDIVVVDEEKINEDNTAKNIIYLTGAIEEPGLYEVPTTSNWGDVVQMAGGLLPYADVNNINLAMPIQDGEHLHIPFNFNGSPEDLLRKGKININTASIDELTVIKGVGKSTAQKIIDYRTKEKPFTKIEDIMNVKGIGAKTFDKLKDSICV